MRELGLFALVCAGALAIGFVVSFPGILMWDDHYRMMHSTSILKAFGLLGYEKTVWSYAPLWELILGLAQHYVFYGLHDEIWVRHSLTFALYPISLYLTYVLLRRGGVRISTAVLAVAVLFGIIRLGGHSLFNMKDLPGALSYLLSSLAIWVLVRHGCMRQNEPRFPISALCLIGVVAVIPFLTRSPLLLHLVLLEAVLIGITVFDRRNVDIISRFSIPLIPLLTGCLTIFLLYPPMWTQQGEELNGSVIISTFLVFSLLVLCTTYIAWTFGATWRKSLRFILLTSVSGVCLIVALMHLPELRSLTAQILTSFQDPYNQFSDFGWTGSTVMFSRKWAIHNLPWWFSFAWIPIIANPVALAVAAAGYVRFLAYRRPSSTACVLPVWGGFSLRLSLERWLWIIVLLSFAAVAVIGPTLYNDERHILFLYPVFFLLGALGLDPLHRWIKCGLAAVVVVASIISYAQWGRYSYIYVSPLVPEQYRTFTGDYWGICMSHATAALSGNVPKGAKVRVDGPRHLAEMQEQRLKNPLALSFDPDYDYQLVGGQSFPSDSDRPFAVMTHTLISVYYYKRVLKDLESGNAVPVLVHNDPFGKPICILAKYLPVPEEEGLEE